jgi:hypothetical protein
VAGRRGLTVRGAGADSAWRFGRDREGRAEQGGDAVGGSVAAGVEAEELPMVTPANGADDQCGAQRRIATTAGAAVEPGV